MNKDFQIEEPFFIVGAPRSGTTLLSVILDRHSNISIPPETQFFGDFQPILRPVIAQNSLENLVSLALQADRVKDLAVTKEDVIQHLSYEGEKERDLFLALMKAYAKKTGCNKVGEKSPLHLLHLRKITALFPKSKIVCIVRDGRDVVRSLKNVPWAEPGNPRRFLLFCHLWNNCVEKIVEAQRSRFKDRFYLLRYELLLQEPERQVKNLCSFLGVNLDPQQLAAEMGSGAVPKWEKGWKGKATDFLDSNRVQVWKREAERDEVHKMNILMGDSLRKMGYDQTETIGCSFETKIKYNCIRIAFSDSIRPLSLFFLKCLRGLRKIVSTNQ